MSNSINLENIKNDYKDLRKDFKQRVVICAGTGCMAQGSIKIYTKLVEELKKQNLAVSVEVRKESKAEKDATLISTSGCQGFCQLGPLMEIHPAKILYTKVTLDDVSEIIEETIKKGNVIDRLLYHDPKNEKTYKGQNEIPFYTQQRRTSLKLCGHIDPIDVAEYVSFDGYMAAKNAWTKMTDEEVCKVVMDSGLRGRGGGGFPTGLKWDLTRKEKSEKKYVICNGDEGDPGAFMDRSILEGTPHAVIEGMMIAAKGIGADEGYIYLRMEYPLAVERMKLAIKKAHEMGILGDNVFGTGKAFHLHVMEGAGAFVCGEETALIASVEGKRGMPKPKPPFPAQSGLFGKPTVINNVETLAMVPGILLNGAAAFKSIGPENSPGTKTFALTGHVANTGLIEVPFGTTLRKIIFDIGGGVTDKNGKIDNDKFKAVQIGGPSGACLTKEHLDLPLDFDSIKKVNAMIGSGGLVVMNEDTCMVSVAKFFMQFTQNESCGKCVLCREGTKQMLAILEDIIEGKTSPDQEEDIITKLQDLGQAVQKGSLCALGKTAPNPVLSTIRNFGPELRAHISKRTCPTGECKALVPIIIDPSKCIGCTACARKCPVGAISGKVKEAHSIDQDKCIKCEACIPTCKFNAISYKG